jgi:hypothetical protein
MAGQVTGWQAMGKPDFATCGKLFYRLPAELRNDLNRSEEKVLIWAIFLTWWQSAHSGRQTALGSFSETWLGTKFGRSRWTVARALAKLEGWNLLKRIRRNPKRDGTFQTNLIALSAKLHGICAGFMPSTKRNPSDPPPKERTTTPPFGRQVPGKSPCSKTAPQEVGNVYKRDKAAPFSSPPLVARQENDDYGPASHAISALIGRLSARRSGH